MTTSKATYQQQAYEHIKEQILTLGYKPGEHINDSQVARVLNISRTPVREALYRLENEGLLQNEARRGWRVYSLSLDDIHEIFDIKESIEGMIARRAAACTDPALRAQLQRALEDMERACAADDPNAWLRADIAIHEVLFKMAHNERARRVIVNLNDHWHRVRIGFVAMRGRMVDSTREHAAFIDAILAGDGERAEELMRAHLNQVRGELVRLLANLVMPFVENGV